MNAESIEERQERLSQRYASWLRLVGISSATLALCLVAWLAWPYLNGREKTPVLPRAQEAHAVSPPTEVRDPDAAVILKPQDQEEIGLKSAKVAVGATRHMVTAPGKILPDETHYAFITPRASGVVRTVNARLGQEVKAGELLATVDSAVVGDSRLELFSRLQALSLATTQADWQETIYLNTMNLIERLEKGEAPQAIHEAFTGRPVGENRERLMTAYARNRLALATMNRNRELHAQNLITLKQFQQVEADYEVAQATYESLMDQMGFETKISYTRAQQLKVQAENAVRAAQERLRILGVNPDGTDPAATTGPLAVGKLGENPPGTREALAISAAGPEKGSTRSPAAPAFSGSIDRKPVGEVDPKAVPVSNYSIWAPFDGTILDREMIIPGVTVDTSHRMFTLADLSSVYVEVNIHENSFDILGGTRGGQLKFTSPAYPGHVFEGEVIYSGDLVEDTSRTVKLLGRAKNPGRLLKPGMFVDVEVMSPNGKPAVQVPATALLTHASRTFVFVKAGPDRFVERDVVAEGVVENQVLITRGLRTGEEVVTNGAYKLKALASGQSVTEH